MDARSVVVRDDDGKPRFAATYVPHRRAIHADWDDLLSEGDWIIRENGDTGMSHVFTVSKPIELEWLFDHPEDLEYCLRWYFSLNHEHVFRRYAMYAFLRNVYETGWLPPHGRA